MYVSKKIFKPLKNGVSHWYINIYRGSEHHIFMKKIIGILIVFIWASFFFYAFNDLMPKNIVYVLIALPIVFITSFYILKKSGFNL